MKQREKLLTQASQDHSPAFSLVAGNQGTLSLVLNTSSIAGFPGDPLLEISVWWQYCNIKPLGNICESILLSLEFDLNSRLDTENDVMKENTIYKATVWLSRLLLFHFLIQEYSSILLPFLSQLIQHCSDHLQGVMQGTVPYLGTFLTDLIMLDTALQDYIEVILGQFFES